MKFNSQVASVVCFDELFLIILLEKARMSRSLCCSIQHLNLLCLFKAFTFSCLRRSPLALLWLRNRNRFIQSWLRTRHLALLWLCRSRLIRLWLCRSRLIRLWLCRSCIRPSPTAPR